MRRLLWRATFVAGVACLGLAARGAGPWLVCTAHVDTPDIVVALASHEWERLPRAAQLARAFPRSRVWLTEPTHPDVFNCDDCQHRMDTLVLWGVARDRVTVLPDRAANTWEEALAVRRALEREGLRPVRVAVVTSAYHTRRAGATFRTVLAGTGATVGVYDPGRWSEYVPARWWAQLYGVRYVGYELAATLVKYPVEHGVMPWY